MVQWQPPVNGSELGEDKGMSCPVPYTLFEWFTHTLSQLIFFFFSFYILIFGNGFLKWDLNWVLRHCYLGSTWVESRHPFVRNFITRFYFLFYRPTGFHDGLVYTLDVLLDLPPIGFFLYKLHTKFVTICKRFFSFSLVRSDPSLRFISFCVMPCSYTI